MEPLARLFGSNVRVKLLRLFLFNEELSFSFADAAERSKSSRDNVRKELATLVAAGVVKKKTGKSGVVYGADRRFPHYEALQVFIRSTTSLRESDTVNTLKRAGNLRLVVLSGLFTGAMEPKVDLLVVGDKLEERPLDNGVRALEAELGRELRFASFSTEDFKYRRGVYDRLLRDIFDFPHRVLLDKIGLDQLPK
jgi:hypothetical protein